MRGDKVSKKQSNMGQKPNIIITNKIENAVKRINKGANNRVQLIVIFHNHKEKR